MNGWITPKEETVQPQSLMVNGDWNRVRVLAAKDKDSDVDQWPAE